MKKNKLWQRYSKGEKLEPTYDTIKKNRIKSTFDYTFFGGKQGEENIYKDLDLTIKSKLDSTIEEKEHRIIKYFPTVLIIMAIFLIVVAIFGCIVKGFCS